MDQNPSAVLEGVVDEDLSSRSHVSLGCRRWGETSSANVPREEADQVLLLVVLNVQREVCEVFGESWADGEGLLRVSYAHSTEPISARKTRRHHEISRVLV